MWQLIKSDRERHSENGRTCEDDEGDGECITDLLGLELGSKGWLWWVEEGGRNGTQDTKLWVIRGGYRRFVGWLDDKTPWALQGHITELQLINHQ